MTFPGDQIDFDAKAAMTPAPRRVQVLNPNLGFYNDRAPISMDSRALSSCLNVRIRHGEITNERMGWTAFVPESQLPHPITHITQFRARSGSSSLLICTQRDVCTYNAVSSPPQLEFLNPLWSTGTATIIAAGTPTTVTGAGGTSWLTEAKVGDWISFSAASYRNARGSWYKISAVDSDTQLKIEGYTGSFVGAEPYTIRKTLTAIDSDVWSSVTFPAAQPANEDTWYACTGAEMIKWNGTANEYTILSLGFVAKMVAYYKNMLYYGDLVVGSERRSTSLRNSDVAQPEVLSGGTASEISVVNGTDRLLALEILGDHLVCLAERSVNVVEFVGDPIGHTIRTALQGIGPFAERLVVNQGDYLEFLSHDRAYRFDGVGKSEMGAQVFREVLRSTDPSRAYQSFAIRDEEEGEIHWVVALTTDPDFPVTSHVEHYLEPVGSKDPTPFTVRELPATAIGKWTQSGYLRFNSFVGTGDADKFQNQTIRWDDRGLSEDAPIVLFGDKDGLLWHFNAGENKGTAPLWSGFTLGRQGCIDGQVKAMCRTIEPWFAPQTEGQMVCSVYMSDDPQASSDSFGWNVYNLDRSGSRRIPLRVSGRFFEVQIVGLGTGTAVPGTLVYSFNGYEVELVPGGRR